MKTGGEPEGVAMGTPGYGGLAGLWSREAGGPSEDGTLNKEHPGWGDSESKGPREGPVWHVVGTETRPGH